jgi:hypothetical protein
LVVFEHPDPTVLFDPVAQTTGAHYNHSISIQLSIWETQRIVYT